MGKRIIWPKDRGCPACQVRRAPRHCENNRSCSWYLCECGWLIEYRGKVNLLGKVDSWEHKRARWK